ncbi:MAG: type VI secretion system membrane subunit TssM [bacterium]|nr:type VI secretion system membrane subunit TssM [bacterium]
MAAIIFPYPRLGYMERTIIVVAFILLTLPFVLLFGFVMSRRKKKKEAQAAEASPSTGDHAGAATGEAAANTPAPAGSYGNLSTGAEEAVQFLKSSNLGSGGRDAIYGLPWYLVAGAPSAGKSSLVISSNLNFQNLPSQRAAEQNFVRPTATVDWRVTSEAVFIDSAGRYQTEGLDADEWSSLLETVKKYRSNRPLDGVILVVDADRVLKADEREIEELAKVQRARLDEVMQRLKVRFPVYLVFTHADAIEGFRDSFSASKAEDKALVWGSTIPIEKSENAQTLFDNEYAILHDSLMKRRIARLSAPFPPVRQLKIFNFPLHFATGRRKFGAFVSALFRPNPFSENPFLRGFYFTATPAAKSGENGHRTVNSGYFTERLFKDVVLRDKDLVTTFIAQRQKPPIFGWFITLLSILIVVLLLGLSAVSVVTNNQMLGRAEEVGDRMLTIVKADGGRNPLEKNDVEAKREINTTEEMRQLLAQLDEYEREGPPFYMRFGMYSGNAVYKRSLLPMYFAVVEQRYKKPMVAKLEAELRKFADSTPVANSAQLTEKEEQLLSRNYDLLKAYLMLSGEYKTRAESSHLSTALGDLWAADSKVPVDMKLIAQQQLEFWSKQVDRDEADVQFPRINLNGKLVDDTRKKLQAFPAKYRYLSRKVTEISKEIDETVGKTTAERMLTDKGADPTFIESNYSVPSAYTRPGYEKMQIAILEANVKLSEDDWVMGEQGRSAVASATDANDIQERYYRDYADHWRAFVKNTKVRPFKNAEDAASAFLSFSSANSSIKVLAGEIKRNTNLSGEDEQGWFDWIKGKLFKQKAAKVPDTQPEKDFRALVTFIGTPEQGEKAPVEVYRTQLGNVHKSIAGKTDAKLKEDGAAMAKDEGNDPLKLRKSETAIAALLAPFKDTPAGQEVDAFLRQPIDNLKALLGAGAKDQIGRSWTQEIMPAANDVAKGFPFDDGASEADLAKLTAFLNPTDGKFTVFYKEKLATFFEEVDSKVKVKEGAPVQFNDEFVTYVNSALSLQKALFGSNPTPKFEYEFSIKPGAGTLIEVNIDGQKVTSEGTGSIKGTFPASGSAETGVIVRQVSDSAPAPAASSNSNTSAPSPSSTSASGPLTFPGNWGLFRFVDAGNRQQQAGGEYTLTYSVGGKSLSATIKPSGGDPFDKSLFRNLKAPQTIVK